MDFVIWHTFCRAAQLMTKPVMSEQYFRYWPDRNSVVNVKLGGLPFGTDYTMTESMSSRLLTEFRDMHESEQAKFFERMPADKRSVLVAAMADIDIENLAYDFRECPAKLLNIFRTLPGREQEKFFDCMAPDGQCMLVSVMPTAEAVNILQTVYGAAAKTPSYDTIAMILFEMQCRVEFVADVACYLNSPLVANLLLIREKSAHPIILASEDSNERKFLLLQDKWDSLTWNNIAQILYSLTELHPHIYDFLDSKKQFTASWFLTHLFTDDEKFWYGITWSEADRHNKKRKRMFEAQKPGTRSWFLGKNFEAGL